MMRVQQQLLQDYPQLKQKRLIVQYYVSLQYPQKQRKIVNWWSNMIDAAIRRSKEVYISPADLQVIFSLHGLKPVPLKQVLKILAKTQNLQWRDRNMIDQELPSCSKSAIKVLINYIFPIKQKNLLLSSYKSLQNETQSKVISTKFLRQVSDMIKNQIQVELDHEKNISYDYVLTQLKKQLPFSIKSIEFVMLQLQSKSWMIIDSVSGKKVIFFSQQLKDQSDKKWIQIEKQKFNLKSTINTFNKKIQQKIKEQQQKLRQAKNIAQKDKQRAKKILIHVKNIRTSKDHLSQRVRALRQALDDLQISQANNTTIDVMKVCQQIVKNTMKDPALIQQIMEKNDQIKMNQKQINLGFQQLNEANGGDQIEDQVDNMMKQLQKDIQKSKRQKAKQDSAMKFVDNQINIQQKSKRPPSVLFRKQLNY